MNIFTYAVNLAGPYHIEHNIPCQDSFAMEYLDDTTFVAAIADGLGSAKCSDIGSRLAADTAVAYCKKHLTKELGQDEILSHLKAAFQLAYTAVETKAFSDEKPVTQYDTTLCLALYDGKNLYYGQSGDSGLIALFLDGHYEQVTTKQQDDMGRVYPLRFGSDYWAFGKTTNVAAAMLATDGVLDHIFHPLLAEEPIPLDVPLAGLFMERHHITESEAMEFVSDVYEFLENYPADYINDDKTVVVMINKDAPPARKDDDYYQGPSWKKVYKKLMKKGGLLHECLHKLRRAYHLIRASIGNWWRGLYLLH